MACRHTPHCFARAKHRPNHIHAENLSKHGARNRLHPRKSSRNASVVHQSRDRPQFPFRSLKKSHDFVLARNIGLDHAGAPARRHDVPSHVRDSLAILRIVHDHAKTARSCQLRDRCTNAPARAGYDQCSLRSFLVDFRHASSLFEHRLKCTLPTYMSIQERRSVRPPTMASEPNSATPSKSEKRKNAWKSLPDVWALIKPRRSLLAFGLFLMAINRFSGLVLPLSTKYFIDNVVVKKQIHLLTPIVLGVLLATIIQGLTSFTLTQLLSKSAQRMITDLRKKVQAHIGRLPVSFYDANKTGVLVSRIMSDVEGVRNLIGTGLVEFVGGLMTAVIALGYLLYTSPSMTAVAFA